MSGWNKPMPTPTNAPIGAKEMRRIAARMLAEKI
jgi:hypothetical protein